MSEVLYHYLRSYHSHTKECPYSETFTLTTRPVSETLYAGGVDVHISASAKQTDLLTGRHVNSLLETGAMPM